MVDHSALTARPSRPERASSTTYELPSDTSDAATSGREAQQVKERAPTTPTTPTFILSPTNIFGALGGAKAGEPMLLGGWSRSRSFQAKGAKQRPSLHNPSAMLSDNSKTDVASLASYADGADNEKGAASSARASQSRAGLFGLPSLRYMLYTRKGRRDVATNLRAWSSYKKILVLALMLVVSIRVLLAPSAPVERGVNGRIASRKSTDAVFLNNWIDHVVDHPVRARDKAGFAEMGLRTEVYSHLLRHKNVPNFDRMERALWPFVPGINQLRKWWQASVQAKPHQYAAASTSPAPSTREKLFSRGFGSGPLIQHGSRGIVMSLGYKGSVFASQFISIIREKHHNDIPIELYYYGDSDLPTKYRDYLTKTYRNVRCIDLESLGLFDPDLVKLERQGFAIKPFALLATNFTEVILADADAILLEDPDHFFEEPGYLDTGTLFFHDRDHLRKGADDIIHDFMNNQLSLRGASPRLASSEFWKKKGIFEQESGIVVVDKRKTDVFAALLFTAWQNMGEIREKTTYRIWWGDKETFWLAFEFANFPYYFVPRYAQAIGTTRRVSPAEKLERAAKAKAKAEKAKAKEEAEKAKKGGKEAAAEAPKEVKADAKNPVVKSDEKKAAAGAEVVHFDEAGDALPAADPVDNPFKEGILPGEPEPEPLQPPSSHDDDLTPSIVASTSEEEEEFCSEHPLHFLGADIEDNNGDGVADAMSLGRPAWFNGAILDTKTISDEVYINPNAFSLDGTWEFLFDEEQWCMRNYTLGNIRQFDLTDRIDEIKSIAKNAELKFHAKIPKLPKKVKKDK
ncbi:Alpha-1,3-mannosyltransferase MNT3 [Pseudozyma hubeiensis]|nr:Alpha-1,3-mannosyltransferase MNT3 [Pseudozyma hubeiensis]